MSFYDGLPFFLALFFLLIPAVILGIAEKKLSSYQTAVSILFILLILGSHPRQFLYLALFYLWSLAVVKGYLYIRTFRGRQKGCYYLFLSCSLLPLALCKVSPLVDLDLFGFTGISYMSFRCIQILIDTYDGVITRMPVLEYTGFLLFFPSLSSGPIDRSQRFHQDWSCILSRKEYLELAGTGIYKLLLGLVYKLVLATQIYQLLTLCGSVTDAGVPIWLSWILYSYLYGFYLFFDFAGYSLMAVGTACFLGVRLPENFRKPFTATDIRDFWDRWHITLSHWFRDFIFTRFIMSCTRHKWFSSRLQRACAGFLLNMGIMGLWHGLTPSYLLYGLYHGILLSCNEIYQRKSHFYKKYRNRRLYKGISWFITLQFVMFGFFIFSGKFLEVITIH